MFIYADFQLRCLLGLLLDRPVTHIYQLYKPSTKRMRTLVLHQINLYCTRTAYQYPN
jgi:hypothetical protein